MRSSMLLALLLFACSSAPEPGPRRAPGPKPSAPRVVTDPAPVNVHMGEHLQHANAAREALVDLQLADARSELAWLAEHPPPLELPEAGAPFLRELKEHARVGALAPTAREVATALGKLAATCGGCHEKTGAKPNLGQDSPAPPPSREVLVHMASHRWAVERMWASLVVPDATQWERAAAALGDDPLTDDDLGGGLSERSQAAAVQVHTEARLGVEETDAAGRAKRFGAVIEGCFDCHAETRGE